MDKITKTILSEIVNSEDRSIQFHGMDEPFSELAPSGTINASIQYLLDHNYIMLTHDFFTGQILQISVTHRTIHPVRFTLKSIVLYLFHNWIAIVALIVSIIALSD